MHFSQWALHAWLIQLVQAQLALHVENPVPYALLYTNTPVKQSNLFDSFTFDPQCPALLSHLPTVPLWIKLRKVYT